jgi:phosphomannomutase
MSGRDEKTIVLFDVDGTLTPARGVIAPEMKEFLSTLRGRVMTGMVGGSDLVKQVEQLGDDVLDMFDYTFPQNGLVAYKSGAKVAETSFKDKLGEENLKALVNFMLRYLADIECPVKRGTFIEFRTGMLNVSPIGRNCSREERNAFEEYDKEHGIRAKFVETLKAEFAHLDLQYSIGGQISFDVFPKGWDKTYCLRFLKDEEGKPLFDNIHFFGDKTFEGGNDFEIFSSEETIGHTTTGPEDTRAQCEELFMA